MFLVAVETTVSYPLVQSLRPGSLGMIYLLGVVMVSIGWGIWLGAATAIVSAVAYDYFHIPAPTEFLGLNSIQGLLIPIFLVVAFLVGVVAGSARSHAIDAARHRRQANEAAEQSRQLAEKHAALRRVAAMAMRRASATEIFTAVAREISGLLPTQYIQLTRFEPDETMTVVGSWTDEARAQALLPVGSRWETPAGTLPEVVLRTGRPARHDVSATDELGPFPTDPAITSAVGCPITVEGRIWGLIASLSTGPAPQPATTEARITECTELLATAIADAENRTRLTEAQNRIVTAVDHTHRRIESQLHEHVRGHLYTLALQISAAQNTLGESSQLKARLSEIDEDLVRLVADLRNMFWCVPPQVGSIEGFTFALDTLARRCDVPVELTTQIERRLPPVIETAVYQAVSEALTNATHFHAFAVHVDLNADRTDLRLSIRYDGLGGATLDEGSELIALRDRVEALGGRLEATSHRGDSTSLMINVPISGGLAMVDPTPAEGCHAGARVAEPDIEPDSDERVPGPGVIGRRQTEGRAGRLSPARTRIKPHGCASA
jgi:signal transduction histidine kinase